MPREVREYYQKGISYNEMLILKEEKSILNKKTQAAAVSARSKGTNTYTNGNGKCIRLRTDDPRVLSGEFYSPKAKPKFEVTYKCAACDKLF
jgi:hypothetical protein